jgi:hypothetical protein
MIKRWIVETFKPPDEGKPQIVPLIISNLIPVIGVLFLQWKIFAILILYAWEFVLIAAFRFLKQGRFEARNLQPVSTRFMYYVSQTGFFLFFVFIVVLIFLIRLLLINEDPGELDAVCNPAFAIFAALISVNCYFSIKQSKIIKSQHEVFGTPISAGRVLQWIPLIVCLVSLLRGSPLWSLVLTLSIKLAVDLIEYFNNRRIYVESVKKDHRLGNGRI